MKPVQDCTVDELRDELAYCLGWKKKIRGSFRVREDGHADQVTEDAPAWYNDAVLCSPDHPIPAHSLDAIADKLPVGCHWDYIRERNVPVAPFYAGTSNWGSERRTNEEGPTEWEARLRACVAAWRCEKGIQ